MSTATAVLFFTTTRAQTQPLWGECAGEEGLLSAGALFSQCLLGMQQTPSMPNSGHSSANMVAFHEPVPLHLFSSYF